MIVWSAMPERMTGMPPARPPTTIPIGVPTTILVAPDSFKGTFSAGEVAGAIAKGLADGGRPVDVCPIADGGEGTRDVLARALGTNVRPATVQDPLGRSIDVEFGLGANGTAVVEAAAASGLSLVAEHERDPVAASTYGTGQLIVAAVNAGARTVYLGVGGSATTDGGTGAIRAINDGGGLDRARILVLCDVRTPFEQAARVFGPQKGAGPAEIRRLTRRLQSHARRFPRDPRGVPMTGAAGGLSGGLWAQFGAELVPGAAFVLEALGFDGRMRAARAVVTGEGQLDGQSLVGKVVSEVATRARQAGVPCHAIVGRRELDAFGQRILDLQAVLEAQTLEGLERAGRQLAALV
jgi:glycerate kinase